MKIVILSYYNPWISGGGHRPVCFLEQDISKGNDIVFIFESDAETENMRNFPLFFNPKLKLIQRDKRTGHFQPMNEQAAIISSEEYLITNWKPDYVRSHNPVGSYIEFLKKCKSAKIPHLYDQMDYWDGFPVQPWGECTENDYIALSSACMTISNWLVRKNALKTPKKFAMIPNAIKESFAVQVSISYEGMLKRDSRERKAIVYSGAIWPEWFDWNIMSWLIKSRPEYDFIMIGAYNPSSDEDDGRNVKQIVEELMQYENVHFLGQISHEKLVPYLKQCNVAVIPFVVNDVTEACSPLKCYEYLGASMPVVTTALPEIETYPMVYTASSKEHFLNLIDLLVQKSMTESEYDSVSEFISNNTWKARSTQLDAVVQEMLQKGD